MSRKTEQACTEIMTRVEDMMGSVSVARLTNDQYEEIQHLRTELKQFCALIDPDGAERMEKRIVSIIKEGPPGYG